jgi:hypothetical protein
MRAPQVYLFGDLGGETETVRDQPPEPRGGQDGKGTSSREGSVGGRHQLWNVSGNCGTERGCEMERWLFGRPQIFVSASMAG